jgi:hypothetical protein
MDYRMNNIGSKIISNYDYSNLTKPNYPFPKPSITQRQYDPPLYYFNYPHPPPNPIFSPPVYNNSYMNLARKRIYNSLLKDKIDDLEDALMQRQTLRKENTLAQVHSLSQLPRSPLDRDNTSSEMLKIMGKQQDLIGDLANSIKSLGEKINFPHNSIEYGIASPQIPVKTRTTTPKTIKSREEVLKELDISSDHESEYLEKKRNLLMPGTKTKSFRFPSPKKNRGIRKFRALVWAILFPAFIFHEMNKRKGMLKIEYKLDMESLIESFTNIAARWVLQYTRSPIMSILQDQSLDFNISGKDSWYSKGIPDAINTKKLKLHVRVKGLIEGLQEGTSRKLIPLKLIQFFSKFLNNGAFIPEKYFSSYEKSRLEFDKFGSLRNQDDEKRGMMIAFFIITRILVAKFLLSPEEYNLPVRAGSKAVM